MPLKKGVPEAPLKVYADGLYTLEELAGVLRCDVHTIYNYRLQGRFKCTLMGPRVYRVSGSEIHYLKAHGLRPVSAKYRKAAAAIQRDQRAKRKAKASAAKGSIRPKKMDARPIKGKGKQPRARERVARVRK